MGAGAQTEPKTRGWGGLPVALYWDQSLVWGLICLATLDRLKVPVRLLSSTDIRRGALHHYRVLLVPGGWASHKVRALGGGGKERLREFLTGGGGYLGFCGGAGLVLDGPSCLGLVPVKRLPFSRRLPNASGRLRIEGRVDHPAWQGLPGEIPASIWWPSQFDLNERQDDWVLARYRRPESSFWVADLCVGDVDVLEEDVSWSRWEAHYGMNLDPQRLAGVPAIIETTLGRGRLVLSYPHLETPGDERANELFRRLLFYLDRCCQQAGMGDAWWCSGEAGSPEMTPPGRDAIRLVEEACALAEGLIRFGERHLLWRWRCPWLLHWRRGLRGLEYGTLVVTLRSLAKAMASWSRRPGPPTGWLEAAAGLHHDVEQFCRLAPRLLLEEKVAAQSGVVSKMGAVNPEVDGLRHRLFGSHMNHGGLCHQVLSRIDALLLDILRLNRAHGPEPACLAIW